MQALLDLNLLSTSDLQEDTGGVGGLLNDWIEDFYKDDSLALSSSDVYTPFQQLLHLTFPGGVCECECVSVCVRVFVCVCVWVCVCVRVFV